MTKTEQNNAFKTAAAQRTAEMQPTPVVRESFEAMQARAQKPDPVKTEGTTEVPNSGVAAFNDPMRQRFEAMEAQKEKDIKEYVKQSDGKPKV